MFPFVDLLFIVFIGFYGYRGYQRGVIREGIDLLGFVIGLGLAIRFAGIPANLFTWLGTSQGLGHFLGGASLFLLMVVGSGLASRRIHSLPRFDDGIGRPLQIAGATLGGVWSAGLAVLLMVIMLVIPTAVSAQSAIRESLVGRTLLGSKSPVYTVLEGFAQTEALPFISFLRGQFAFVQPQKDPSQEFFRIAASDEIKLDPAAESRILELVNRERTKRGLGALSLHEPIRVVARGHSADMYRRGYFSHTNPDGQDPFDRMEQGGIDYTVAGENLALAPTVEMVHRGLMQSPRHRDNILKPEYTDLGVGVYAGPNGLMVTQNFCTGCR